MSLAAVTELQTQDVLSLPCLSQRIRAVLASVPLDLMDARRVAQDIHALLSRLHGVGSQLHSAITEVGRQYLKLVAGLSTTDIVTAVMKLPLNQLAAASAEALFPVAAPLPLLLADFLAPASEAYLARQIEDEARLDWSDPPEPKDTRAFHPFLKRWRRCSTISTGL